MAPPDSRFGTVAHRFRASAERTRGLRTSARPERERKCGLRVIAVARVSSFRSLAFGEEFEWSSPGL